MDLSDFNEDDDLIDLMPVDSVVRLLYPDKLFDDPLDSALEFLSLFIIGNDDDTAKLRAERAEKL